jgi:hypothetical protein
MFGQQRPGRLLGDEQSESGAELNRRLWARKMRGPAVLFWVLSAGLRGACRERSSCSSTAWMRGADYAARFSLVLLSDDRRLPESLTCPPSTSTVDSPSGFSYCQPISPTASGERGVALVRRLGAGAAVDGKNGDIQAAARAFGPEGIDAVLRLAGGRGSRQVSARAPVRRLSQCSDGFR